MHKIILFFSLLFFSIISYGQQSLEARIKQLYKEKDTVKLQQAVHALSDSDDEMDIAVAVNYYLRARNTSMVDSLKRKAITKFPKGDFAFSAAMMEFKSCEDYPAANKLADEIVSTFAGRPFSSLYGILATKAAALKDLTALSNAYHHIKDTTYLRYYIPDLIESLTEGDDADNRKKANTLISEMKEQYRQILQTTMLLKPAPLFTLKDRFGNDVSLSSLRGKTIIVDFWATWCKPCLASFPGMQLAIDKYKKDSNVVFLFVNTGERDTANLSSKIQSLLDKNNYSFNVLMDTQEPQTKRFPVSDAFKVVGLPTKYLIDKNGNIRFQIIGGMRSVSFIPEEIEMMVDLIR